jgi:small-conductance mechanosensitive channel
MVQRFKNSLALFPPAFWVSILSILGVGFMAFGAVKYTGVGNAGDIKEIQVHIGKIEDRIDTEMSELRKNCAKKHDKLTEAFNKHCAWGATAKAVQDQERALLKKDLEYIQKSLARQEKRMDRTETSISEIFKVQRQILQQVISNGDNTP